MYKEYIPARETMLKGVYRLSDGAWIPFVEENADYQAYLKWISEGNKPLPADE